MYETRSSIQTQALIDGTRCDDTNFVLIYFSSRLSFVILLLLLANTLLMLEVIVSFIYIVMYVCA